MAENLVDLDEEEMQKKAIALSLQEEEKEELCSIKGELSLHKKALVKNKLKR